MDQILAFGQQHPEDDNRRLVEEEKRLETLRRQPVKKPILPDKTPLTSDLVRELNGFYGIALNIFKLKRAGITAEILVDAAYFTSKKHTEQPFDTLEGAIVHAAMQREKGIW